MDSMPFPVWRRSAVVLVTVASVGFAADKPDAEKGNEVFDEQCSRCHHAASLERKVGPGLKLLFAKEKLESNGKPVNEANVMEKIEKGGGGMPAFQETLSKDDKADLLAYLKTF